MGVRWEQAPCVSYKLVATYWCDVTPKDMKTSVSGTATTQTIKDFFTLYKSCIHTAAARVMVNICKLRTIDKDYRLAKYFLFFVPQRTGHLCHPSDICHPFSYPDHTCTWSHLSSAVTGLRSRPGANGAGSLASSCVNSVKLFQGSFKTNTTRFLCAAAAVPCKF